MSHSQPPKEVAFKEQVHHEAKEDIPPELETLLHTNPSTGLSDHEVSERIQMFGLNEIQEKKNNPLFKFLSYFLGPISYLLEAACILSGVFEHYVDFGILLFVLILNACIGYFEEARAESALDALKNNLALKTRAWRNGKLVEIDSHLLVPGDVIALRLGDIVPADCRLLGIGVTGEETEGTLQIDQAALTGESLPVQKGKGATAYSSSIVKQGQMLGVVTKTGLNTFIGRAANLISITVDEGHFQKIVNTIGNFLVIITCVMGVVILIIRTWLHPENAEDSFAERFKAAFLEVLILTIAAIPVGLPTVLSVTMAVGASQLAKKQVIVKRLTAIEELASVSILCSDKTGTLTLNQLTFDEPYLAKVGNTSTDFEGTGKSYTETDLLLFSFFASEPGAHDAIECAVRKAAQDRVPILKSRIERDHHIPGFKVNNFTPFNPSSKFTEATVTNLETGEKFRCIKGAPQVVVQMVGGHNEATNAVNKFAVRGLRALGVARTIDAEMKVFEMIGMISLLDPPRPDSAYTIQECGKLGISVKMITGDQQIIGKEVAHRLGMHRNILDANKLIDDSIDEQAITDRIIKADGFAQVVPEHKFKVVELLQKRGFLVGMTGDGVNDAPALKKANVGIAVEGCTDAARSASDIVLLAPGLNTIVDGVRTSRAIFQRMRSYALYRIASTIHFLLFFFISISAYGFSLPARLIILIAVLNDAATLVISVDNAQISQRPDKWRIGQLMFLSFLLGFLLMLISFCHFFVGVDKYGLNPVKSWYYNGTLSHSPKIGDEYGVPDPNNGKLETIMYLQISSCPHFVIFSTRLPGWFFENMPSWTFIIAVAGTQVFAMLVSVYGVEALDATSIGWDWGAAVLAISTVMFMLLDVVKVFTIRNWSFELTARLWPTKEQKAKLAKRNADNILRKRVYGNIAKMRKVLRICTILVAWKQCCKVRKLPSSGFDSHVTLVI